MRILIAILFVFATLSACSDDDGLSVNGATNSASNSSTANASNATTPNASAPNSNNTTRPPLGDPSSNPACVDNDGDGFFGGCPEGNDCHDGNAAVNPGASEVCDDNLDNDCTDGPDNGCGCDTEGAERPCYTGPAGTLVGSCSAGLQTCSGGAWSACAGSVTPVGEICDGEDEDCDGQIDEGLTNACGTCGEVTAEEECGDGLDNNCDGRVDEGCACDTTAIACYAGTADTRNVGACSDGTRVCEGEFWGECTGSVTPVGEICGDQIDNDCDGETDEGCNCDARDEVCDGVDNDCDGIIDEGCTPCLDGAATPWQFHLGEGPICFDETFGSHGDPGEYAYATIPPADDAGWMPEPDDFISFDDPSTMCGQNGAPDLCPCRGGGDFTYFQTFFDVPPSLQIDSLSVRIDNVDDGARITIFNDANPGGVVDQGSYAFLGGGSTSDLAQYIVAGTNRIVITHVDDCCAVRRIAGVNVTLNGEDLQRCD